MISLLTFSAITTVLLLEGAVLAELIFRDRDRPLSLALGLPLAALINVLIVFDWTVLGIPLNPYSLLLPHLLLTKILVVVAWKMKTAHREPVAREKKTESILVLNIVCSLLIAVVAGYSFVHAVLLPTFQYDSATNWTMRSEISFYDHRIAFDPTEVRGMAKPQYPFLFHALQITVNQGQRVWNDTAANAILWLLSASFFLAFFFILRRISGATHALLTLTLVLGIPLLSVHLAQGYGDILLTQELLLSLALLIAWIHHKHKHWLFLSMIFAASTVWTKTEGMFFGLVPWLFAVAAIAFSDRPRKKEALIAIVIAIILSIPWPIFAWSKGLLLTPHSSDTAFGFHPEGLKEAFIGLFDRGSFGITWYVITAALLWFLFELITKKRSRDLSSLTPLLWGLVVFVAILFIYLFTPNVRFLLNAESYYRQMMIPSAMLITALSVLRL